MEPRSPEADGGRQLRRLTWIALARWPRPGFLKRSTAWPIGPEDKGNRSGGAGEEPARAVDDRPACARKVHGSERLRLCDVRELSSLDHLERPEAQQQDREQRHRHEAERADADVERGAMEEIALGGRDRLDAQARPEYEERRRERPPPAPTSTHRYPVAGSAETHACLGPWDGPAATMTPEHSLILSVAAGPSLVTRPILGVVGSVLVRARGLAKTYGEGQAAVRVLDGADLDVDRGDFVAVVGRSGSGKSTLLHLLGGLDRPDAGEIELDGDRVDRLDERGLTDVRRRKVGFVFQAFHLLPELSGIENVLLPAKLARDGIEAAPRAAELIEQLGLSEVAGRLPSALSGGEQQRLAVARALVNDPPLLLADEPTGNLDEESGAAVLDLLRRAADSGRAVVLVTHDRAATALADRVFRLEAGRLVA